MNPKNKALLTIFISFIFGIAAGVFADQLFVNKYIARASSSTSLYEQFKQRMLRELNLSPMQQTQLEKLLQVKQEEFNTFRKSVHDKFTEMRMAARDSIRVLLMSEQRVKFEEMVKDLDAAREKEERYK